MSADQSFLDNLRARLFTAVLSDCLDAAGYRNQALAAHIRPLDDSLVLCGARAARSWRTSSAATGSCR